jgi:hypothetical protein
MGRVVKSVRRPSEPRPCATCRGFFFDVTDANGPAVKTEISENAPQKGAAAMGAPGEVLFRWQCQ